LSGAARPGRVTQLMAEGKGGFVPRSVDPEIFREAQAADHASAVTAARSKLLTSRMHTRCEVGKFATVNLISFDFDRQNKDTGYVLGICREFNFRISIVDDQQLIRSHLHY
jgi:hypothetical protein